MKFNLGEILRTLMNIVGLNIGVWIGITLVMLVWPQTYGHFCKEFKPDSNFTKIYFTVNKPVQKAACWVSKKPT